VRMIVSSPSGLGHLGPILPLAEAARDAGHEVRVVVASDAADTVRRRQLDVTELPPPDEAVLDRFESLSREVGRMVAAGDREAGDRRFVRGSFGRFQCETGLPTLRREIEAFDADLVLADVFHSPSVAAAALTGRPFALALFGVWQPLSELLDEVAAGAAPVIEPLGLDPERLLALWRAAPRFSPLPALFDDSEAGSTSGTVRWRRPAGGGAELDEGLRRSLDADDRPLVYATLGTIAGGLPPMRDRFLGGLLPAVAERDVRCVLTVGRSTDLDALPPVPDNVTVAPFLPQRALLERAALAVSHGGLNTVLDVAAARVPHVVIPLHAYDGHVNASRVEALGAGRSVTGEVVTPGAVGAALDDLTRDETAAAAAGRLADALEALPAPHEVVSHLEWAART
jgi:hypothetical protein